MNWVHVHPSGWIKSVQEKYVDRLLSSTECTSLIVLNYSFTGQVRLKLLVYFTADIAEFKAML
jgi:hypothetical protein